MWAAKALSLALSPAGRVLLGLLVLLWWTHTIRQDAIAGVRAEAAAEVADALIRGQREAQRLSREARDRADRAQAEIAALREEHDAILQLQGDSPDGCVMPDDLVERLRRIR